MHLKLVSFILFNIVLSMAHQAHAQQNTIKLSDRHLAKVEKLKSPEAKLTRYRKYYKKDSIKLYRQADRFIKRWSDSLTNSLEDKKQRIESRIERIDKSINGNIESAASRLKTKITVKESDYKLSPFFEKSFSSDNLKALYAFMHYYLTVLQPDTTGLLAMGIPSAKVNLLSKRTFADVCKVSTPKTKASGILDGAKSKAGDVEGKLKESVATKTNTASIRKAKAYTEQAKAYKTVYGSLPKTKEDVLKQGSDKIKLLAQERQELRQVEELKKQYENFRAKNPWDNQYKDQADQLQDSTYLKEQARKKAEETAMKYLEENPAILEGAQKKMAVLMKKYSVVPNSNDLSSAIKRSSLEGKPLRERVYIATNFQMISLDPVSIDFSPAIGYKLNKRWVTAIGANYRETFSTSSTQLSPDVIGYRGFMNYDVINNFFAYGEYANNSPGKETSEKGTKRIWSEAIFVGVGKKLSIHKKMEMTCLVAYNFLHKPNDLVYPRPLVFRIGFQLSELALLKR
jgi:hypothetical protein